MGTRYRMSSDASGLMELPSPEFCIRTTGFLPARHAPVAMPMASSSLVAAMYVISGSDERWPITSFRRVQGTPVEKLKPLLLSTAQNSLAAITGFSRLAFYVITGPGRAARK